jgi:hypothetical protein
MDTAPVAIRYARHNACPRLGEPGAGENQLSKKPGKKISTSGNVGPSSHGQELMEYRIFTRSTGEPLDTLDMHVLARAYHAAWRSVFAQDPVGPHIIRALDVLFLFSDKDRNTESES